MAGVTWKKSFIIIGTSLAVYLSFRYLLSLLVPFLLAFFLACCLRRPVNFLKKRLHIPITIGGMLGVFILISGLGAGLFFLIRSLLRQLIFLFEQLPVYRSLFLIRYESLCSGCDRMLQLESGTIHLFLESQAERFLSVIQSKLLPALTEHTLRAALGAAELFALFVIIIVIALLLIKDMEEYRERFRNSFFAPYLLPILERLRVSGFAYLRTQLIIMLLVASVCTAGLLILKNPYALLFGIGIALFDALPVIGSGTILVPWCIVEAFQRDFFQAAILLTMFVICLVLREFVEPKLFGRGIGIRPLYTLAAIYIGIRLFGVIGFLLGPLGLVIVKSVWDSCKPQEPADD